MIRRGFLNQEILKRLKDIIPECKICDVANAFKKELNLHHKDCDSSNNKWSNIVIYCRVALTPLLLVLSSKDVVYNNNQRFQIHQK